MEGVRVLVVDDDVDTAVMTAQGLTDFGYDVRFAHDEVTALQLASEHSPEIAVLDLHLGSSSGNDLARKLRGLPGLEDIHLIAVTGVTASASAAFDAGFHAHIQKPATVGGLRDLIKAALRE